MMLSGRGSVILSLAGFLASGAVTAHAGTISFVDIFKNIDYIQTGNGNTLNSSGAFFSADLNSVGVNDYSNVTMTYPGPGSPVSLPEFNSPSTDYHYQTTTFATQGDMDASFPTGTYTFDADNTDTASLQYSGDDYAQSLAYLTGNDYSNLQGMDPANSFTFNFSPFVTGSNAVFSYVFFTIYDETLGETVYNGGFMSSSTTSVTVPGGTLAFGDTFDYEIDFSNRDIQNGTGGEFPPELGFDTRTDGTFSTEKQPASVPEPSTIILGGLGLGALAIARRRKIAG